MVSAIDYRIRFHRALWYGLILLAALSLSVFLASDQFMVAFVVGGTLWLATLPYHAHLAMVVTVTTFSSALILPFIPGRPYMWEGAALLAWTGVIVLHMVRRGSPDLAATLRAHRWVFIGSIIYCVVLVVTMMVRGFGLRILGSGQAGGRLYLQQLLCAIFPLLFAMLQSNERSLVKLLTIQWLLTGTYLIADFAFTFGGGLANALYFVELPVDAASFEFQSMRFGIRRFQSFALVSMGLFFIVLVYNNTKDFVARKAFWLLPVMVLVLLVGMLSGHRVVLVTTGFVMLFCVYAQRFFTVRNQLIALLILIPSFALLYAFADRMPLAAQRAVAFLPGISIDNAARVDAVGTMTARRTMFRVGLEMIPQYLWVGRGFARYLDEYSRAFDPTGTMMHINQGVFYNGFVGLMVNTGVFGTAGMLLFMYGGTRVAWRIIQHLRRYGCEDNFSRACSVVAGIWMGSAISFLFLHGDSEYAMKTFSLQAGVLIMANRFLEQRLVTASAAPPAEPGAVPSQA
ncbi:MAG TPA: O-antigen ligase family protein [Candidatus Paceibacterota bacterium]|nr:O-antigen ligase family protein [Candidatus Paceibacterota bacterium]HRZ54339.1 O-antigen ligase family protein [Candidatus Paceibacterota bacterium]